MPSRVIDLADAIVVVLGTAIGTPTPPLTVEISRVYQPEYRLETLTANLRKVTVFPSELADRGPSSRGADGTTSTVVVVIAERYTEAGAIPTAWMDARVAWVQEMIFNVLRNPRVRVDGAYPEAIDCMIFDCELLKQDRVFFSTVTVTLVDE